VPNEQAGRVASSDQDSPLSSWGYIYLVSLGDEQVMAGEEAQPKMTFHITRVSIEWMGFGFIACSFRVPRKLRRKIFMHVIHMMMINY
jgi:hypothetical protein